MKERTKTFNRMASAVELSDEMVMMGGGSVPSAASRHHHHRSVRMHLKGILYHSTTNQRLQITNKFVGLYEQL